MNTRKHCLLLLLLLCGSAAFAQWTPTANLSVFSEDGAKFFLVLNGERYNDVAQTNIRIEELPNPYYNCKIIFEDKSLPEITKNALMLADAEGVMQDVTYRIKKDNKGRNVLRFYSFVPARQNMVRPATCATYRFGRPNTLIAGPGFTQTTVVSETNLTPGNVNVNIGGVGMNVDMPLMNGSVTTTTTTKTRTGSHYHDDGPGSRDRDGRDYRDHDNRNNQRNPRQQQSNSRGGCRTAMSNADFNDAKNTISNNGFDETKLSTAKQILSFNCLTVNQVTTVIGLFGFEETKLDFARYAYEYCVDKNNYFKVSNAFSFESSRTELNNYVQSMR